MVDEVRKEKGDLDVRYVDWSSDSQRKHGKCPVRDLTDFPVLQSSFWSKPDSFQKSWGDRPTPGMAWTNIVVVLDAKCKVADIFQFGGPSPGSKGSRALKKRNNYRALKASILRGFGADTKTKTPDRPKAPAEGATKTSADVYILSGQSNMHGNTPVSDLSEENVKPVTEVMSWTGSGCKPLIPEKTPTLPYMLNRCAIRSCRI